MEKRGLFRDRLDSLTIPDARWSHAAIGDLTSSLPSGLGFA
jgi:hypothetical protein